MCPQSVYLYKDWYHLLVVLVLASISHNLAKYVLRISLRGLVSSTSTSTSISHDWTKCVLGNYVFTGECVSSGTGAVTGTGIGTGTGHWLRWLPRPKMSSIYLYRGIDIKWCSAAALPEVCLLLFYISISLLFYLPLPFRISNGNGNLPTLYISSSLLSLLLPCCLLTKPLHRFSAFLFVGNESKITITAWIIRNFTEIVNGLGTIHPISPDCLSQSSNLLSLVESKGKRKGGSLAITCESWEEVSDWSKSFPV